MKTTVYRIQDKDGRGPFKPGYTDTWLDNDRTFFPKAPIREQQWIQKIADPDFHIAFVCETIDQLKNWVSETEYARLKKDGYNAVKIAVDKIWTLDGQAIAGRKKQYRKQAIPFTLYQSETNIDNGKKKV